jgi:hypothetical protein
MKWVLTQAAAQGKPERTYRFNVIFSLHTFAQECEDHHDPELFYSDARETRSFFFHRYESSFQLQDVIFNLDKADGVYEVYFTVIRYRDADFD